MDRGLFTVAELRALEVAAQAALPRGALMQRAGAAAADFVFARIGQPSPRIRVLCGPGNNGGDGYVCALHLAQRGARAQCVALAPAASDDARAAFAHWAAAGGVTLTALPDDEHCDAVVDALFGIGMARPLAGAYLAAVQWINRQRAPVFALDVPSGLDADRGVWVGGVAGVQAAATITFVGGKPGLFTADGCDAAGEVFIEPIGVPPRPARGRLVAPADFAALLQPRARNTHKGSYGTVAIVGGSAGMTGAALLAGRAALRLGAGRVYVDCLGTPPLQFDPQQPELMFQPLARIAEPGACVVGCGLGTAAAGREALVAALARDAALVVDADALNLLAADDELACACIDRRAPTVLTPHPLEAGRLLGVDAAGVQVDRVDHALRLAQRFAALVVLKGAGSVVAEPGGRYWINPTGSPALATAGSGDVLAGMIGALLVQCSDPQQAVLAAVWLHGAAADEFGADIGLLAGEIAPLAARALGRLRAGR